MIKKYYYLTVKEKIQLVSDIPRVHQYANQNISIKIKYCLEKSIQRYTLLDYLER